MKKVLLAGTALVGAALVASPAQAELKLNLGGQFSGYGVYVNEDNDTNYNNFEFRRNTEIHFTGETTLDNGLTVGFHSEMRLDGNEYYNNSNNESNAPSVNESYAYFSGGWGRVNFGVEDGAAYLLQVAAPSADSNVDGLRTTIQGFQSDIGVLDYAHSDFGAGPEDSMVYNYNYYTYQQNDRVTRLTYLTPKFNGFQAGVSYAPEAKPSNGAQDMRDYAYFSDLWELAGRWDGQFEGVGISLGAGYSNASVDENNWGTGDDLETWNVGFNLAWNQFSFGAAYKETNNATNNNDTTTWVVGAAWDNGPYHVGVSYLDRTDDNWYGAGRDADSDRLTVGGGYTFGPGMTFRGSVAWGQVPVTGSTENDFTQVTLGTDISF